MSKEIFAPGWDKKDCTSVKCFEHAANFKLNLKINTIKLIHFKLIADHLVKRFPMIM